MASDVRLPAARLLSVVVVGELESDARTARVPLAVALDTEVTASLDHTGFEEYPEDGMYIHGLCMEGAQWDGKKNVIADSAPKDLHPQMPVLKISGVLYDKVDKTGIFDCPVFTVTTRGGTFTFVATLKTNDPVNKWTLAGVALMMSDDIAS